MKKNENTSEKFYIIAVKDELTGTFLQPAFGKSKEEILRLFKHQINTIAIWRDNPGDFNLYLLGMYDENTGEIESQIMRIADGRSVLENNKKEEEE